MYVPTIPLLSLAYQRGQITSNLGLSLSLFKGFKKAQHFFVGAFMPGFLLTPGASKISRSLG